MPTISSLALRACSCIRATDLHQVKMRNLLRQRQSISRNQRANGTERYSQAPGWRSPPPPQREAVTVCRIRARGGGEAGSSAGKALEGLLRGSHLTSELKTRANDQGLRLTPTSSRGGRSEGLPSGRGCEGKVRGGSKARQGRPWPGEEALGSEGQRKEGPPEKPPSSPPPPRTQGSRGRCRRPCFLAHTPYTHTHTPRAPSSQVSARRPRPLEGR